MVTIRPFVSGDTYRYIPLHELEVLLRKNPTEVTNMSMTHQDLFNFSLKEAYDILLDNQKYDRILVPETEVVFIVIYSILMLSGVVSNLLMCFVVAKRSSIQTPRNLYIINLAVADLAMCVVVMPFTLVSLLKRKWVMGSLLCKLVPVVQGTNIMVSSGTITAIALDRYFAIVKAGARGGERIRVIVSIVFIWMMSFLVTTPFFLYQIVEKVNIGDLVLYEACIEKWPTRQILGAYTICFAFILFVIPVAVLSVVHAQISSYLNLHLSQRTAKQARRKIRRNRRTMVILSCIAVVFAISWLPLTVFSIAADFSPQFTSPENLYIMFAVCHIVAMSSACTNPILYGWLNTNLRREFTDLLPTMFSTCKTCIVPTFHDSTTSCPDVVQDRRISMTFLTTITKPSSFFPHLSPTTKIDHL